MIIHYLPFNRVPIPFPFFSVLALQLEYVLLRSGTLLLFDTKIEMYG